MAGGGGGGVDSTPSRKQRYCLARTMNLGTCLHLPKNYPCAKFCCYSSISDVTMFLRKRYRRFCISVVNQDLFHYENVGSIFIWLFGMLECCSLHFNRKNSQISQETVKFWAAKAIKIIKILDLFGNAGSSKFFVKFQCFPKKITKVCPPPPIKTTH